MATKSTPARLRQHRRATIQWIAIVVAVSLAILAAFVFFGEDGTGGGHSGLGTVEGLVAAS